MITGKIGEELTVEEGRDAARLVGLNILASAKQVLGLLDRVRSVVKLLGMVNATEDFIQHPQIINGCSELFSEIWGDDAGWGYEVPLVFRDYLQGYPWRLREF